MLKENILFLRNRPRVFNLGDFLCTPNYYFNFFGNAYESAHTLRNKKYKVILGGGAYNDLGLSQKVKFENTILWGVGSSIHGKHSVPTQAKDLPFLLYGLRDPDAVDAPERILPCVSCLHPLVSIPAGYETNVFLNFDSGVTDLKMLSQDNFFRKNNLGVFTNYLNEIQFMTVFARTRRVITNSYHISYWSLLSGREVAIIGYSSKFRSLLKLVGLSPELVNHYDVTDKETLKSTVSGIMKNNNFCNLGRFEDIRDEFRKKNIEFAKKCRKVGFIRDFKMRHNNFVSMLDRNVRYRLFQKIATWGK